MPLPTPKNAPLFGQRAGVMPKLDRLALATKVRDGASRREQTRSHIVAAQRCYRWRTGITVL